MKRAIAAICVVAAGSAALGLFHIADRVQGLERALARERHTIAETRESIQVLNAEWSYLNRPARIAELAERYLGFGPLAAEQFVGLAQIPLRADPDGDLHPDDPDDPDSLDPLLASAETRQ